MKAPSATSSLIGWPRATGGSTPYLQDHAKTLKLILAGPLVHLVGVDHLFGQMKGWMTLHERPIIRTTASCMDLKQQLELNARQFTRVLSRLTGMEFCSWSLQ